MWASSKKTIAVALTGASGAAYGLRLVECLLQTEHQVYLMCSQAAQVTVNMETELELPASAKEAQSYLYDYFGCAADQLQVFGRQQWMAPVASGSNPPDAMAICPCTVGTLGAIAAGTCDNLIHRAADVMLKEARPLVLVIRETPFSVIHLENMLKVSRAGGTIMPANPGFYFLPETVEEIVDFMVARVLDHLKVDHPICEQKWGQ